MAVTRDITVDEYDLTPSTEQFDVEVTLCGHPTEVKYYQHDTDHQLCTRVTLRIPHDNCAYEVVEQTVGLSDFDIYAESWEYEDTEDAIDRLTVLLGATHETFLT